MAGPVDVVVVGAGFSGLCAAIALRDRGFSVRVLEARDRVGGRVEALMNDLGERVDTGGQFLCDDMPNILALLEARGRAITPAPVEGEYLRQPRASPSDTEVLDAGMEALRRRLSSAEERDHARSLADWIAAQPEPDGVKAEFRSYISGVWCQAPEDLSLVSIANAERRFTNEVNELQYFPSGTMHGLAAELARDLGDAVELGSPVERIERTDAGVRVRTRHGCFVAGAALVAVPPVAAAKIDHEPVLPLEFDSARGCWRAGSVMKAVIRYERPFWRDAGTSGTVMWREPPGLFACDGSWDDDHAALIVFIGGPLARAWRDMDEIALRAEVAERLAAALGSAARDMRDFTLRDWCDERWSGGGYSDVVVGMDPREAEAALRAGAPPVFFASSELSPSFPGYVEGAVVAGRIAAGQVADFLAVQTPIATRASGS